MRIYRFIAARESELVKIEDMLASGMVCSLHNDHLYS